MVLRRGLACASLLAAVLVGVAPAARACDKDSKSAACNKDATAAAAAAARFSERLDAEIARAKLATERARLTKDMPGAIVTPSAILYVDGAEVPLDWIEWADPVQARKIRRAARTDTVFRVGPGVTLALSNVSGDIRVVTWDRDEVRIEAEHDRTDQLVTDFQNAVIKLGVGSRESSPAQVQWKLTVPAWLPLELFGVESGIEISGLRNSVRARSMRGDIMVSACQGPIEANSVEGEVHVTDVSGNVTAGSINNIVRILRVVGPVEAQTINGDIQLEKVDSKDVDASTVNGRVYYASGYRPRGRYVFSSHNGRLFVPVPKDQNVKVTVASYQGQLESSMPVPTPQPKAKGRAYSFQFRDGVAVPDAPEFTYAPKIPRTPRAPRAPQAEPAPPAPPAPQLELESFGGLIRLASQEEVLQALRQRGLSDSLRAQRFAARMAWEARREAARQAARHRRAAPAETAPTPETPPPPPPPNH